MLNTYFGRSSTAAFVAAARPALAVVSVGRDSPYIHPHPEVIAHWRDAGAQVLITGERGMVSLSTDGEDLKMETFVKGCYLLIGSVRERIRPWPCLNHAADHFKQLVITECRGVGP